MRICAHTTQTGKNNRIVMLSFFCLTTCSGIPRDPKPARGDMTNKTTRLHVRFAPAEKAALQRQASQNGLTMSDYIRMLVLDKRHPVQINISKIEDAIKLLTRLAAQHPELMDVRATLINLLNNKQ